MNMTDGKVAMSAHAVGLVCEMVGQVPRGTGSTRALR